MDLESPRQRRWANVASQGLRVGNDLAGDGRTSAFVGDRDRFARRAAAKRESPVRREWSELGAAIGSRLLAKISGKKIRVQCVLGVPAGKWAALRN